MLSIFHWNIMENELTTPTPVRKESLGWNIRDNKTAKRLLLFFRNSIVAHNIQDLIWVLRKKIKKHYKV